jgi:hypothetical protein
MPKFSFFFLLLTTYLTISTLYAQQFPGGVGFPGGSGSFPGGGAGRPGGQGPGVGIDDSTKVIYGPKTTKFFLENDVFNNRKTLYLTDTALVGVHQFEFTQRNQNLLADLGNLGTPLRPVFYNTPTQIGAQQGYYVFSPFGYQNEQVRYYDTKSPFTNMYLVLGGRSQNILTFDFTQNINPRLNVGFNVQRFTSERQFGLGTSTTQSQRLLAQNWSLLLHANYRSADDRYTLLANFRHMNHSLPEQGGNRPTRGTDNQPIPFDYEGQARLASTLGWQRHDALHLYHQYAPAKGIQFFHKLDYHTQINNYEDNAVALNQEFDRFYDLRYTLPTGTTAISRATFGDSTRIQQDVYWRTLDNTLGIKGIFTRKGASYNYRLYYRPRFFSQYGNYNLPPATVVTGTPPNSTTTTVDRLARYGERSGFENYFGGWLGYYFPDSLTRLTADGELLVGFGDSKAGAFRLNGQLESKLLSLGLTLQQSLPPLIAQTFISNVRSLTWANDNFGLQRTLHAYGQLNVRYKNWLLKPSGDFWLLNNYIYFDELARPQQYNPAFTMLRLGLGADYTRARFRATFQAYYTLNAGDDVLRVPTFFLNGRVQYDFIYAKVLHIQTGIELHHKSAYRGYAYMPVTQQYYLSNEQIEGAVLADVFANMRVNRVRFFVKMTHANMGLFKPGYYVAPGFLQIQRGLGFGVDWLLFD